MENKQRLLLVEDDMNLGFVISDKLKESNFHVVWVNNGEEGLEEAIKSDFDLAILDVMLPKLSGFALAEELIEIKPELPFLFLTAKSMLDDKIKGLKLGRDYLTKPFEFEELLVRIENIFKTIDIDSTAVQNNFKIGKYEFDYVNQYLTLNDNQKKLTKKESDVLKLLVLNKNEVLNRDVALKRIWGNNDYFNGRSMDVFISKLRKYLSQDEDIQIINVHGVGFKLAIK